MSLGVSVFLRLLIVGAASASTWIMMTSQEIASIYGFSLAAKYSYSPSFKYLAFANIGVGTATLVSLICACGARRGRGAFALFLYDLCVTAVAISAFSAAAAEGYLGKYGNTRAGWLPICQYVENYCRRVTISLALSLVASLLLFLATILSASASRQV